MTSRSERVKGIVGAMMDGVAEKSLAELKAKREEYERDGKAWVKTTKKADEQPSLFE